jgi:hypothetical protein
LLIDKCVLLSQLLIQKELIEGEPQIELKLFGANLDIVFENLGWIEVVRVTLALEWKVSQSQRRKSLLEIVDLELQDVIHCVKSQFEW